MLKSEKEQLAKDLNVKFAKAKAVILAEVRKVDVATVNRLRAKLRTGKVEWKVLKNTIARRAAKGTMAEVISDDFVGPVAAAIAYDDVIEPAKLLTEFVKDMEIIKIRTAVVQGQKLDPKGVVALAKMPGLPELRAQILGMLTTPAQKLVSTLNEPGSMLARIIKARVDQEQPPTP